MKEDEMLRNNLEIPVFSPEIQVWRTPLNQKLLITGTCGINRELIEKENNFPRFSVITSVNETDSDLLKKIKMQGERILSSLTKINSNEDNGMKRKKNKESTYSTQNPRKHRKNKKKKI